MQQSAGTVPTLLSDMPGVVAGNTRGLMLVLRTAWPDGRTIWLLPAWYAPDTAWLILLEVWDGGD